MHHNQTRLLLPIVKGSSSNQESLHSSSSDSALSRTIIPSLLLFGVSSHKHSVSSDSLSKLPSRQKLGPLGLSLAEESENFWNVPHLWPEPIKKLKKHEYQRSGGDTRLPAGNSSSSSTTKGNTATESSFDESDWFNERDTYSGDGSHYFHVCTPESTLTTPSLPSSEQGFSVAENEMQNLLLFDQWENQFERQCCLHGRGKRYEVPCHRSVCHYVPSICSSRKSESHSHPPKGKPKKNSHQVADAKQEMHRSKETNKIRAVIETKTTDDGKLKRELFIPLVQKSKVDRNAKRLPPVFREEAKKTVISIKKSNGRSHDAPLRKGTVKRVRDTATFMTERDQTNFNIPPSESVVHLEFKSESGSKTEVDAEKVSTEIQTDPMDLEERKAGSDVKKEPRFVLPEILKRSKGSAAESPDKFMESAVEESLDKQNEDLPDQSGVEPQQKYEDVSSFTFEEPSTDVRYRDDDEQFVVRVRGEKLLKLLADSRYGYEDWTNTISDQKEYDLTSDVMIVVGDSVFRSHRLLLAAYSSWFRTTFKLMEKSPCSAIEVPSIRPDIFKILHKWIYSKELNVVARCLPGVYRAAHQLGMNEIMELSIQEAKRTGTYIRNASPPPLPFPDRQTRSGASQPIVRQINGKMEHFRRKYGNTTLLNQFLRLQPQAFREITAHRDFFNLHVDTIRALFSEDALDVKSELEVFDAAFSWLAHDWPGRIAYAKPILECVRFSLMSQHEIVQLFFNKKNLAAIALPICRDLILKAFLFWAAYTTGDLDRLTLPILGDKRRHNVQVRRPARLGRWAAAVRIQTACRGWLARDSVRTKQGAAMLIQATYRSYLTRNWLKECSLAAQKLKVVLYQQEKCRNLAATVIQSNFKGAWVRKHMKKLARAALIIQKSWRGHRLRTKLKHYDDYYFKLLGDLDLLLIGGLDPINPKDPTKSGHWCYLYRIVENKWITVGLAPTIMLYSQAVFIGQSVYVMGGCISRKRSWWRDVYPVANTWSWNLVTNRWRAEPYMRHARMHHSAVSCYGRIFVIGGVDDDKTILDSIEMFDTKKRTWYEMQPMRAARMGFCALYLDGKIFVCGGIGLHTTTKDHGTLLNAVESYFPSEDRWEDETPLPCPRCFSAALRDKYFLYIVGGVEIATDDEGKDVSGSVDKVEVYNIIKRQWKPVWKLRSPRHAVILLNYRHQMIVFGGLSTAKQNVEDTIELYDLTNPQNFKERMRIPNLFAGMAWVHIPSTLSPKLLGIQL